MITIPTLNYKNLQITQSNNNEFVESYYSGAQTVISRGYDRWSISASFVMQLDADRKSWERFFREVRGRRTVFHFPILQNSTYDSRYPNTIFTVSRIVDNYNLEIIASDGQKINAQDFSFINNSITNFTGQGGTFQTFEFDNNLPEGDVKVGDILIEGPVSPVSSLASIESESIVAKTYTSQDLEEDHYLAIVSYSEGYVLGEDKSTFRSARKDSSNNFITDVIYDSHIITGKVIIYLSTQTIEEAIEQNQIFDVSRVASGEGYRYSIQPSRIAEYFSSRYDTVYAGDGFIVRKYTSAETPSGYNVITNADGDPVTVRTRVNARGNKVFNNLILSSQPSIAYIYKNLIYTTANNDVARAAQPQHILQIYATEYAFEMRVPLEENEIRTGDSFGYVEGTNVIFTGLQAVRSRRTINRHVFNVKFSVYPSQLIGKEKIIYYAGDELIYEDKILSRITNAPSLEQIFSQYELGNYLIVTSVTANQAVGKYQGTRTTTPADKLWRGRFNIPIEFVGVPPYVAGKYIMINDQLQQVIDCQNIGNKFSLKVSNSIRILTEGTTIEDNNIMVRVRLAGDDKTMSYHMADYLLPFSLTMMEAIP